LNPISLFVSHASEDKEAFVRPLANGLIQHRGFKVFYDDYSLVMGNSLLQSISKGLRECQYGVVVFSPSSVRKKWPQEELAGLLARESAEHKIILPILHNLTIEGLLQHYPTFADRIVSESKDGIERVITDILRAIRISQRTKEVNTPLFNKIEAVADMAAVRDHSDRLRNSELVVKLASEEVQRLFDMVVHFLEPNSIRLGLEIVRGETQESISARRNRFNLIKLGENHVRESRYVFTCEYPGHATQSSLRDINLRLRLIDESYDRDGNLRDTHTVSEWVMTPVFTASNQVVWTMFGGGAMHEMTSEALIDHVLTHFVEALERSIRYGHPV